MAVSVFVVIFITVVFITVVFAGSSLLLRIASICIILRHMGLQLQRLSYNHQLLCRNVVLKTSYAIYHFGVKRAETIKMAEDQLFISCCKLFTLMCLPVNNFSDCWVIIAVSMVVSLFVVVFIVLVFVWSFSFLRIALPQYAKYYTTAAEAFISSSAVVQEGSPKD